MENSNFSGDNLDGSWIFIEKVTKEQNKSLVNEELQFIQDLSDDDIDYDSDSDGISVIADDQENYQCCTCCCDSDVQRELCDSEVYSDTLKNSKYESLFVIQKYYYQKLPKRIFIFIIGLFSVLAFVFLTKKITDNAVRCMNDNNTNISKQNMSQGYNYYVSSKMYNYTLNKYVCIKEDISYQNSSENCIGFCIYDLLGKELLSCMQCPSKDNVHVIYCNDTHDKLITNSENKQWHDKQNHYVDLTSDYHEKDKLHNYNANNKIISNTENEEAKIMYHETEHKYKDKKVHRKEKIINNQKRNKNFNKRKGRNDLQETTKYVKKLYKRINEKERDLKHLEKHIRRLLNELNKVEDQLQRITKKSKGKRFRANIEKKHKAKNDTNGWYEKMFHERSKIRYIEHLSDWIFERSTIRNKLRNKANWYFERGMGREYIRYKY